MARLADASRRCRSLDERAKYRSVKLLNMLFWEGDRSTFRAFHWVLSGAGFPSLPVPFSLLFSLLFLFAVIGKGTRRVIGKVSLTRGDETCFSHPLSWMKDSREINLVRDRDAGGVCQNHESRWNTAQKGDGSHHGGIQPERVLSATTVEYSPKGC